jgi:DNA-binding beta-propeller fold protein YncE
MRPLRAAIAAVHPLWAVEGGVVTISGAGFQVDPLPEVLIGGVPARLLRASSTLLAAQVPSGLDGGRTPIRVEGSPGETAFVEIGAPLATGLHQVDNPAFDGEGNLYVTFSGSRGQESPVSVFVVRQDGSREPFVSGLPNPTSMVFGRDGHLYVSSRFDGSVHRVARDGSTTTYATDLGVACGIAFGPDGALYVGDRSGSILRVLHGAVSVFASLPGSVAAFHLAFGPDGALYVAGPTLSPRDPVYRLSRAGEVSIFCEGFGRPQGLAFDADGRLYVVDSLAGASGVFRFDVGAAAAQPEPVVVGGSLIGLAFDPRGGVVLASSDTAYRLDVPLRGALVDAPRGAG